MLEKSKWVSLKHTPYPWALLSWIFTVLSVAPLPSRWKTLEASRERMLRMLWLAASPSPWGLYSSCTIYSGKKNWCGLKTYREYHWLEKSGFWVFLGYRLTLQALCCIPLCPSPSWYRLGRTNPLEDTLLRFPFAEEECVVATSLVFHLALPSKKSQWVSAFHRFLL